MGCLSKSRPLTEIVNRSRWVEALGERGIEGKSLDEAARIRTAEAEAACKVLGATPRFFGQIDGATELTHAHVGAMTKLIAAEKPDVILAHWPIDTHMDHQVASLLAICERS